MNDMLRDFLHEFAIVCVDDVCVYNHTLAEDQKHMRLVLQRFKEEGLKLRLKKYFFGLHELEYLDFIVSGSKISVLTHKVKVFKDWPIPTKLREARC
jgi:hypothetical protein